ncbi:MAG: hypothetical protein M3Q27_00150 [Actinomycetota bacterium]|nr:hypothetical protein [Actinomycetota bacterium]
MCCAVSGRPLAAALTAAYGDRVWECTHLGGDRFAGNVAVLPHGYLYGRVSPAAARPRRAGRRRPGSAGQLAWPLVLESGGPVGGGRGPSNGRLPGARGRRGAGRAGAGRSQPGGAACAGRPVASPCRPSRARDLWREPVRGRASPVRLRDARDDAPLTVPEARPAGRR